MWTIHRNCPNFQNILWSGPNCFHLTDEQIEAKEEGPLLCQAVKVETLPTGDSAPGFLAPEPQALLYSQKKKDMVKIKMTELKDYTVFLKQHAPTNCTFKMFSLCVFHVHSFAWMYNERKQPMKILRALTSSGTCLFPFLLPTLRHDMTLLQRLPECPSVIPHELNQSAANMSCGAQSSSTLHFVWPRALIKKCLEVSV